MKRFRKPAGLTALLALCAVCLILLYILHVTVFHRRTPGLTVAILTGQDARPDTDAVEKKLRGALSFADNQMVLISVYPPNAVQTEQMVITQMRAHALDLLVADEETFHDYQKKDCFTEDPVLICAQALGLPEDSRWLAGIPVTAVHRSSAAEAIDYWQKNKPAD